MTETTQPTSQKKAVLVVGFMFAIFIVPNIYIFYIYKTGNLPSSQTTEKGIFFKPFIDMKTHSFSQLNEKIWLPETFRNQGTWAIMDFADQDCEKKCLDNIFNTQQAISALTRYKGRVEQIILVHPDLTNLEDLKTIAHIKSYVHLLEDQSLMNDVRAQLKRDSLSNTRAIVDPESQLLLFYPEENSIQEILRDIKRLLKTSVTHYSSEVE